MGAQVGILKGFNPLSGGLEAAPPTYPFPERKTFAYEEETSAAMFPGQLKAVDAIHTA